MERFSVRGHTAPPESRSGGCVERALLRRRRGQGCILGAAELHEPSPKRHRASLALSLKPGNIVRRVFPVRVTQVQVFNPCRTPERPFVVSPNQLQVLRDQ